MDDSKLHSGVRRSRETEATSSGSGKRRRFDPLDQENAVQLENQCRSGVDVNFPEDIISSAESDCCDHVLSSQCFNNDLSLDLKVNFKILKLYMLRLESGCERNENRFKFDQLW